LGGERRDCHEPAQLVSVTLFRARATAAIYYVAPNGSDAAGTPGTRVAPLPRGRAQAAALPGATAYFLAGVYKHTVATSTCVTPMDTVNAVILDKSGTSGRPSRSWAYFGETPASRCRSLGGQRQRLQGGRLRQSADERAGEAFAVRHLL
jgi:hypothetical protein